MSDPEYGDGSYGGGGGEYGGVMPPFVPPPVPPIVTQKGWGFESWGTGSWGATSAGVGLSLVGAVALSTHSVKVTLSTQPLHIDPSIPGDALNPATWNIQRLDNGFLFNVTSVTEIDPLNYIVTVVQPFASIHVLHQISSATLVDSGGNLLIPPRFADFAGLQSDADSPLNRAVAKQAAIRDLANSQTPLAAMGLIGGTLQISSAGDYVDVAGSDLVKKLIIRRLISSPGDFFHLPNYGVGLPVKDVIPAAELVKLQQTIIQQIKQEPEVDQASCSITQGTNNVMTIQVKATLKKTGSSIKFGMTWPPQNSPQTLNA